MCYQFSILTNRYVLVLPYLRLVYAWTSTGYEPQLAMQHIAPNSCNVHKLVRPVLSLHGNAACVYT